MASRTQVLTLLLVGSLSLALAPAASAQTPSPAPPAAVGVKPKPAAAKKKRPAKNRAKKDTDDGDWIDGGATKTRAGKPGAAPKGVRAQFESAQQLYDQGKYEQALVAFDALTRRYPDNEPARIQLAKTLYRLDRIKDSYAVFSHIDPQHLDPETSYEFAWSFYIVKQYPGALFGFQRVPKGHALFDLANYYGAICAIKLKKYEDAEDMLEKAVVLPDKLAKSRTLYIKHVQALRLMKEKGALAKERNTAVDQLNKDLAKEKGMGKVDPNSAAAKSDKPAGYLHQGLQIVERFATVSYAVEHQDQNFHGLNEQNFDARIGTVEIKSGPLLPITAIRQGKDRVAAFGLGISLKAEDRVQHGTEQRTLADENNADLTRVAAKDLGVTDEKSGDVGANPWIEIPLPENLWVAFGGDFTFHYPEFSRGSRTGSRKGFVGLGAKVGVAYYSGEVSYSEIVDPKTKPSMTVSKSKVVAGMLLPSKFLGEFKAEYELNDYRNDSAQTDGPDSLLRAILKGVQEFPLGIFAGASGLFESQQNYIFHKIPTYGQVAADGQVGTGKVWLLLAPPALPWISAEISEQFQKTKWTLENETAREPFELNVADYTETFAAKLAINLAF